MRLLKVLVYSLSAFFLVPADAVPFRMNKNQQLFLASSQNQKILTEKSSESSNLLEEQKILLQQSEADDIVKLNDFYNDAMSTFQTLNTNEQQRLQNTQTQLSMTVQSEAIETNHNITTVAQEMINKAKAEEETNKQLLNEANQLITKGIQKIQSLQQEVSNNIKDSTILSLESQLIKLQGKFDKVNEKLQAFTQTILVLRSNCNEYTECGECTADAACGWCVSEQRCIDGTKSGPVYETCSFYSYSICSGSGCLSYKDCSSCLDDPSCGWCGQTTEGDANSARCLEKPANYTGCPARVWFHSEGVKNVCDPEIKKPFDLDAAETLEMLGYQSYDDEDVTLRAMKNKLEELQAESEALRDRLNDISEQIKILALERFRE